MILSADYPAYSEWHIRRDDAFSICNAEINDEKQGSQQSDYVKGFTYGFRNNPEALYLIMANMKSQSSSKNLVTDISGIDLRNCTYAEFLAVLNTVQASEKYRGFPECDFTKLTEDEEKRDYLTLLADWRDEQEFYGNMVGYNQAVGEISALVNYEKDIGNKRIIDMCYGGNTSQYQDSLFSWWMGWQKDHTLSLGSVTISPGVSKSVDAYYDDSSTLSNPVILVEFFNDDGKHEMSFKVNINSVNPMNATGMEMFALYAHQTRQSLDYKDYTDYMSVAPYDSNYNMVYSALGYTSIESWMTEKHNWPKIIAEYRDSILKEADDRAEEFNNIFAKIIEDLEEMIKKIEEKCEDEMNEELVEKLCTDSSSK